MRFRPAVFPAGAGVILSSSACSLSDGVFPAGAGVILKTPGNIKRFISVPRRCGGDPIANEAVDKVAACSPQVRG